MARKIGSSGPKTAAAIREAGLKLMYKHGFAAISLQQLAEEVGIQKSSIYNYIDSKQELLFEIVKGHMKDLLIACARALPDSQASSTERLEAFARFHVLYHVERKAEMFIANSELRSLEPNNLATIIGLRREYEDTLISILQSGDSNGEFKVPDINVASFGILAMLSSVGIWFKSRGRLSKEEVASILSNMVLRSVGVPARPRHGGPAGSRGGNLARI